MLFSIYIPIQHFQSWSEFYDTEEIPPIIKFEAKQEQKIKEIFIEENFYVKESIFNSLKESEYGGGIFINTTSDDSRLLIEESYFYNCTATIQGGGIYKESNGHSVINKVCSVECKIKTSNIQGIERGAFCDIITANNEKRNLNYVINSYINKCENEIHAYILILYYGKSNVKHINMSYNNAKGWSCFSLIHSKEGNSTFSTFENNTSLEYGCLAFECKNVNSLMKNCNIIYNKQASNTTRGLFYSIAQLIIEDSTFIDNVLF